MKKIFFLLLISSSIIFSQTAEDYNKAGVKAYDEKNYYEALQNYNMAIQLNPYFGTYYYNRAEARCQLRDYINALQDFNRAIYYDPEDFDAYTERALLKAEMKDYQGAVQDFKKAKSINADWFYIEGYDEDLKHYEEKLNEVTSNYYQRLFLFSWWLFQKCLWQIRKEWL